MSCQLNWKLFRLVFYLKYMRCFFFVVIIIISIIIDIIACPAHIFSFVLFCSGLCNVGANSPILNQTSLISLCKWKIFFRHDWQPFFVVRKLKQQRERQLKINFWKWWLFCDYWLFFTSFIVDGASCKWTGRSAVEVNAENERVYCCVFTSWKP